MGRGAGRGEAPEPGRFRANVDAGQAEQRQHRALRLSAGESARPTPVTGCWSTAARGRGSSPTSPVIPTIASRVVALLQPRRRQRRLHREEGCRILRARARTSAPVRHQTGSGYPAFVCRRVSDGGPVHHKGHRRRRSAGNDLARPEGGRWCRNRKPPSSRRIPTGPSASRRTTMARSRPSSSPCPRN